MTTLITTVVRLIVPGFILGSLMVDVFDALMSLPKRYYAKGQSNVKLRSSSVHSLVHTVNLSRCLFVRL